jgi:predicted O-methyltransferase YrrM
MNKKQSKIQLLKNVVNSVTSTARIPTMVKMVLRERGIDTKGSLSSEEDLSWLQSNVTDFSLIASQRSPDLWNETEEFYNHFKPIAEKITSDAERQVGYHLGGGGYYPFLYFITRSLKPECVVETGVATGYSSQAFLKAMSINGKGRLFSSDFQMFRLTDPEKYIGIVVDDDLRSDWNLFLEGDEVNLPLILESAKRVDIFHYDSDKSYKGRAWATSLLEPRMNEHSFLVMDDIQDNSFFHDYVAEKDKAEWMVFAFENKYVGLVGQVDELISVNE